MSNANAALEDSELLCRVLHCWLRTLQLTASASDPAPLCRLAWLRSSTTCTRALIKSQLDVCAGNFIDKGETRRYTGPDLRMSFNGVSGCQLRPVCGATCRPITLNILLRGSCTTNVGYVLHYNAKQRSAVLLTHL